MPQVIRKQGNPLQFLVDALTQPKLDQSVPVATMKGALGGMIEGVGNLLPSDPVDIFAPSPMMAGAKGFGKGIRGFLLPDNKVVQPDVEGTARILEGDQAMRALERLKPKSVADVPSVRQAAELSDVAVPIQDSIDTNMAPGAPILRNTQATNFGREAAIKRAKLTADQVYKIRELHERGWKTGDISEYTGVHPSTVSEVKNNLSYGWVPPKPTSK